MEGKMKTKQQGLESVHQSSQFYGEDITAAIGDTPLIKLRQMTAARNIKATVLVKPEFLNPTGSVKDRMAVYLLDQAVERGELPPGGTIVEATSGNTGAAVAMYAAANGYKTILTIPDKMSDEKVNTLKAFGNGIRGIAEIRHVYCIERLMIIKNAVWTIKSCLIKSIQR